MVRMAIPDVTTLFVKLTFRSKGAVNGPVVLSLVAIGPREKVAGLDQWYHFRGADVIAEKSAFSL